MIDRQPTKPGRTLITPENGTAPFYAKIDMADEPYEGFEGTEWNKRNVLTDATAAAIGLTDPTPNEAFRRLAPSTPGAISWDSGNLVINNIYTATPLNDWSAAAGSGFYLPNITRVGNIVNITAALNPGIITTGTIIFYLPDWATPSTNKYMSVANSDGSNGFISISPSLIAIRIEGGIAAGTVFFNLTYGLM